MNKVIINKTYRVPTEDLDDGTGFNNDNNNNNSIDAHSFSFNNVPQSTKREEEDVTTTIDPSIGWSVMDNQQVTLTTIVTRLTLLTLMAIFFNILFALFLLWYYLYTYNNQIDRDYGITYCGRAIIAAINGLVTLLNFNFCHRKYYRCCKCCHKSLFRCFVKRNSNGIKGLSMHLDIETNQDLDIIQGYKSIRFSMNNSIGKLSSISVFDSTGSTEFEYVSD